MKPDTVRNLFFAVAIVLLLVLIFRRVKVTCDCRGGPTIQPAGRKLASNISLAPCTWEGEEACIRRGASDDQFLQYPDIPFNNPYPYYNPAASEEYLNPWPNPPREGVVPENFNRAVWKPERWKPNSTAWAYKDATGSFPSAIEESRKRYYAPPFARREPPYYLMDYPGAPAQQTFYNPKDSAAVWPYTRVPVATGSAPKAALANVRNRKRRGGKTTGCDNEPNYHDFVSEQRSYY